MTEIETGDKVMCLYRDPRPDGRIHLGRGIVIRINEVDMLTLFSVHLDTLNTIIINNIFPDGAITHYDEKTYDKMWNIYYGVFKLIKDSEKKYFEMLGIKVPDNTIEPRGDMFE